MSDGHHGDSDVRAQHEGGLQERCRRQGRRRGGGRYPALEQPACPWPGHAVVAHDPGGAARGRTAHVFCPGCGLINDGPIFAAIERAAVKARSIALDVKYQTNRAFKIATDKADVEDDAVDTLFETTPTTVAGVATLLDVLGRDPDKEDELSVMGWRYNGGGRAEDELLLELAETLRTQYATV